MYMNLGFQHCDWLTIVSLSGCTPKTGTDEIDRHESQGISGSCSTLCLSTLFCSILRRDRTVLAWSCQHCINMDRREVHDDTMASVPIVSASWSSVCSSWSSHSSPAFPLTISNVHNDYTQTHPRHTYTVTIPKHPWHTQLFASLRCCPQVGTFFSTNCFLLLPDQTRIQARWGERDPWIKHMTLVFFFSALLLAHRLIFESLSLASASQWRSQQEQRYTLKYFWLSYILIWNGAQSLPSSHSYSPKLL